MLIKKLVWFWVLPSVICRITARCYWTWVDVKLQAQMKQFPWWCCQHGDSLSQCSCSEPAFPLGVCADFEVMTAPWPCPHTRWLTAASLLLHFHNRHAMKNQETRRVDYCEILALFLFSFYCSPNNMHCTRVCSQHRSQVQQSRSWTSVTSSHELLKVYIKYVLGREGFRPRAAASDFVLSAKVKLWQVKCTGSV